MAVSPDHEDLAEGLETGPSLESGLLADFDRALECAADKAKQASRALGPEAGVGDRFDAGLQAVLDAAAAQPDLTRLCLVEAPGLGGGALASKEAGLQLFVEWLERELSAGGDDPPSSLVAEMVVGGIYEVLQQRARAAGPAALPGLGAELRQLWLPLLRDR